MTPPTYPAPGPDGWTRVEPGAVGLDAGRLRRAVAHHLAHESPWRRDFRAAEGGRFIGVADEPPAPDEVLGPVRPRGGPDGLVVRHGRIAAEWGDTLRPDMSFSIAKSYLSILAGVALGEGRIRDLDDRLVDLELDDGFDAPQNRAITWRHLLQQTSEWQGTLWGKPDSIDHHRDVRRSELGQSDKGTPRALRAPGTWWEYNDVRVNRLSLSLLRAFAEPLPAVLKRAIMDPIGASDTWQWQPYRASWVDIGGVAMPSVPGGSHWGGGLWMASRDHARVGLLMLRDGVWSGARLLPPGWVAESRRPCPIQPTYGLLWWLNTGGAMAPRAPEAGYAARGAGSNVIWIDPVHDLVAVVRWIDKAAVPRFLDLLTEAVAD